MNLNPDTHVILTFPAIPNGILRQQGVDIPIRAIVRDKAGAPIGVRLEIPYDDVTLIHAAPITEALRARMREAIADWA